MIRVRRSEKRGEQVRGAVRSRHAFSFGAYRDEEWDPQGALLAINEKEYGPGAALPAHSHRNVEILTYVLEGCLVQADLGGDERRLRAGEVGVLSAGTGVRHEECNGSPTQPLRLLQVWLAPEKEGAPPSQRAKGLGKAMDGELIPLIGSDHPRDLGRGALQVSFLKGREGGSHRVDGIFGRRLWVQVLKGAIEAGPKALGPGDGADIYGVRGVVLRWEPGTELLLVEQAG